MYVFEAGMYTEDVVFKSLNHNNEIWIVMYFKNIFIIKIHKIILIRYRIICYRLQGDVYIGEVLGTFIDTGLYSGTSSQSLSASTSLGVSVR